MTKSMVTKPADGIDAAPIEATVAVKLMIKEEDMISNVYQNLPDND